MFKSQMCNEKGTAELAPRHDFPVPPNNKVGCCLTELDWYFAEKLSERFRL